MNFINSQNIKFNKLINGFFINKFNLSISKKVNCLENNKIYVNKNIMVLSNKIINLNYNTNLDQDKYSMVYILYRNSIRVCHICHICVYANIYGVRVCHIYMNIYLYVCVCVIYI